MDQHRGDPPRNTDPQTAFTGLPSLITPAVALTNAALYSSTAELAQQLQQALQYIAAEIVHRTQQP